MAYYKCGLSLFPVFPQPPARHNLSLGTAPRYTLGIKNFVKPDAPFPDKNVPVTDKLPRTHIALKTQTHRITLQLFAAGREI